MSAISLDPIVQSSTRSKSKSRTSKAPARSKRSVRRAGIIELGLVAGVASSLICWAAYAGSSMVAQVQTEQARKSRLVHLAKLDQAEAQRRQVMISLESVVNGRGIDRWAIEHAGMVPPDGVLRRLENGDDAQRR